MNNFVPIQIDKSHIATIGERLYSQGLDLVRELVSNAYDADATVVKISIGETSLAVEDNGSGMNQEGVRQYLTIGSDYKRQNPFSPKFKRTRIGEFGIGKFAVLSVCDRFEIFTRSEKYGATVIFDRNDFENRSDWNVPIVEHPNDNKETGTRISLFSLKKPFSLFDIERQLIQIFPLNDKEFSIFLNDVKLQSKYIPGERFKVLEKTRFGEIKGDIVLSSLILAKEQTGVGIRVKGVLVKRETFGVETSHAISTRRLTGEIQANFLPITASRNDFVKDREEYLEFEKILQKKLRRVVRSIQKSTESYHDKKAEEALSEALVSIKEALKKNNDILLLDALPLFSRQKNKTGIPDNLKTGPIGTVLSAKSPAPDNGGNLKKVLKELKPKIRSRVKTLLRDRHRVIKTVKIGGSEFLVSFAHLGPNERESFVEGGIIFINRDHALFAKIEGKTELTLYHLIRLITQEIVKLALPRSLEIAYDWQGKLIKDAFTAE